MCWNHQRLGNLDDVHIPFDKPASCWADFVGVKSGPIVTTSMRKTVLPWCFDVYPLGINCLQLSYLKGKKKKKKNPP